MFLKPKPGNLTPKVMNHVSLSLQLTQSLLFYISGNTADWVILVDTKCPEAFIIFDIVNALLLFIVMGLLGHLLIFHGYLCKYQ